MVNVLSFAMRPEYTASGGSLLREGSTKGAPMRTSSRFSRSQALLKRHMAECFPPNTHSLESSSKSLNISSSCGHVLWQRQQPPKMRPTLRARAVGSNIWREVVELGGDVFCAL